MVTTEDLLQTLEKTREFEYYLLEGADYPAGYYGYRIDQSAKLSTRLDGDIEITGKVVENGTIEELYTNRKKKILQLEVKLFNVPTPQAKAWRFFGASTSLAAAPAAVAAPGAGKKPIPTAANPGAAGASTRRAASSSAPIARPVPANGAGPGPTTSQNWVQEDIARIVSNAMAVRELQVLRDQHEHDRKEAKLREDRLLEEVKKMRQEVAEIREEQAPAHTAIARFDTTVSIVRQQMAMARGDTRSHQRNDDVRCCNGPKMPIGLAFESYTHVRNNVKWSLKNSVSSGKQKRITNDFIEAAGILQCPDCIEKKLHGFAMVVRGNGYTNCRVCFEVFSFGKGGGTKRVANPEKLPPHLIGMYCDEKCTNLPSTQRDAMTPWLFNHWFPAFKLIIEATFKNIGATADICAEWSGGSGFVHGPIDYLITVKNRNDRTVLVCGIEVDSEYHKNNQNPEHTYERSCTLKDAYEGARTILYRFSTSGAKAPRPDVDIIERFEEFRTVIFHWMNLSMCDTLYPHHCVVYYMYPRDFKKIDYRCMPCMGFINGPIIDSPKRNDMADWASTMFQQPRKHWGWTKFTESKDIFPPECHELCEMLGEEDGV
jgi:hypothetical protein